MQTYPEFADTVPADHTVSEQPPQVSAYVAAFLLACSASAALVCWAVVQLITWAA